jgi:hypothetical protein
VLLWFDLLGLVFTGVWCEVFTGVWCEAKLIAVVKVSTMRPEASMLRNHLNCHIIADHCNASPTHTWRASHTDKLTQAPLT